MAVVVVRVGLALEEVLPRDDLAGAELRVRGIDAGVQHGNPDPRGVLPHRRARPREDEQDDNGEVAHGAAKGPPGFPVLMTAYLNDLDGRGSLYEVPVLRRGEGML